MKYFCLEWSTISAEFQSPLFFCPSFTCHLPFSSFTPSSSSSSSPSSSSFSSSSCSLVHVFRIYSDRRNWVSSHEINAGVTILRCIRANGFPPNVSQRRTIASKLALNIGASAQPANSLPRRILRNVAEIDRSAFYDAKIGRFHLLNSLNQFTILINCNCLHYYVNSYLYY